MVGLMYPFASLCVSFLNLPIAVTPPVALQKSNQQRDSDLPCETCRRLKDWWRWTAMLLLVMVVVRYTWRILQHSQLLARRRTSYLLAAFLRNWRQLQVHSTLCTHSRTVKRLNNECEQRCVCANCSAFAAEVQFLSCSSLCQLWQDLHRRNWKEIWSQIIGTQDWSGIQNMTHFH